MRKTLLITLFLLCLFGVARAQFFNSASKMNVPALESGTLIFSDNFDAGNLDNWVTIDADGDGHTWVHSSTPEDYLVNDADISGWGHNSSEGFVISGSYSNSNGGVLHPDNYLVTKEKVALGGTLVFWSCTQDSDFPYEHFGVAVSTTSNSDASTFTMLQEWTMTSAPGMKLSPGKKALSAPKQEQGNWYQYIVDLSAYAGQEGYVAFRHFYCSDQFILNIDDVEIYDGTPNVAVIPTNVTVSEITENSVKVSWDGAGDSFAYRYRPVAAPVPGEGNWYYYDNGTYGTSVGTGGGTFDWGIMIPAGTYEGTKVSKVKVYDGGNYNMTGTLTIYNDGTTAPENAVASQAVTFPGDTEDFIEFTVDATIDPTKNVWVIFSNESGATYPAHASNDDSNDPNGRWVGLDGDWMDLAEAGVSGYTFMVRAYIETPVSAPMMADAVSKAANPNMPRRAKDAAWQEGSTSDNYVTLEGLDAETQYEVQVQSVVGSTNSEWSAAVNFTTLAAGVACDAPTDLAVSDITDQSATVSWNGDAASYEMEIGTEGSSSGEAVVYDFNDGLQGWTNLIVNTDGGEWLHSSNNPSAYDYSPYMNGGGFAMCYSYIDNDGAYDTDAYLVSPQTFDIVAGSELTFKANNANVSYPESISVCVAETTGTPTAADFTVVATPTVSTGYDDTPTEISVDLSAYAGKSIWIAFHDQNYDAYEIWIDDIAISGAKKRAITWTPVGEVSSPYELTGLDPETEYSVRVRSVCGGSTSEWVETSFTTLAAGSVVETPTDLTIDNITDQSATAIWSGSNDSYNIRYREVATTTSDVATVILSVDDVWGDGSGYQMLLDADANAFGSVIPETGALTAGGDVDESIYAEFEYKIPENADGALSTANMLVDASAQIEIPAGTYDWCITNPTPGDRMWIASAGGTVGGRADDYVFEGGKTYEFHVYMVGGPNDATDLTVTEVPAGEWTTVEDVTSPYTLTGLTAETEYEVQVQGVTDGNASEWTSSVTFTTSEATGINGLKIAGQENWYTIDGRKLAKRPTTAGVYILNRSKVIIK